MLELVLALRRDGAFLRRLPGLGGAFALAEAFYRFHSFALECVAFLATWFVLDLAVDRLAPAQRADKPIGP